VVTPSTLKGPPPLPSGSRKFPVVGITETDQLSGRQKAALLLYSLGTEVSVEVMKHLGRDEARQLSEEIARISLPNPRVLLELLREFQNQFQRRMDNAQKEKQREAEELAKKMPFRSLRQLDADEIASILAHEQAQTIALVLSYLNPEQAADVLSRFPRDMQTELVERIATIQEIPNDLVRKIEAIIDEKAKTYIAQESAPANADRRMETIARILQRTRVSSDELLDRIKEANPSMAKELRLKAFTFEDIMEMDDRILQKALPRVKPGQIALALKIASEALTDKILNSLDPMLRENVKDQRDLMGPKTLMEIEDAQREIITAIKQALE
jgi:flagellar motor switch protein FliG